MKGSLPLKRSLRGLDFNPVKPLLLLFLLVGIIMAIPGCTTEDEPGYVSVIESVPIEIDGSPEVKVVDTDGDIITIDVATRAITTIEYEHYKIHSGSAFFLNVNSDDLDDGITLDLTMITPDTLEWGHIVWSAEGTAAIHIFVYEGTTTDVKGSPRTPFNRDRNSTHTSIMTCSDGDTFLALGTLLWQWHTGDRKFSGSAGERDELILKQNTQYLFRVESEAADNKVSALASWYEHTNKD